MSLLHSPVFRSVKREGSFLWLLRNEFRLWLRGQKRSSFIALGILLAIALVVIGVIAVPRLADVREYIANFRTQGFAVYVILLVYAVAFVMGFMQVTERCINVLYERNDLDLLLSSPVSTHAIFAVRYTSLLFSVLQSMSLVLVPLLLLAIFSLQPWILSLIVGFIFVATLCSSLALFTTLALVRLLGAKRARIVVQIISSLVFAFIFILSQLPSLTRSSFGDNAVVQWFRAKLPSIIEFFDRSIFLPDSWLWIPQRSALGEPLPMVITLVLSALLAWISITVLKGTFVKGQGQSLTDTVSAKKVSMPATDTKPVRFSKNQSLLLMTKEWKLILRDPELLSKVALQVVFLLPLLFIIMGDNRSILRSLDSGMTISAVFIGSSLIQVLLSIILSGEESRDLLQTAPVAYNRIRRLKLLAALLPIWVLLAPLFVLLMFQGINIIMPVIITIAAHISAAIMTFWSAKPMSRKDLFKRGSSNKHNDVFLGFLSFGLTILWVAFTFAFFTERAVWAIAAIVAILISFAVAWLYSRRLEFV